MKFDSKLRFYEFLNSPHIIYLDQGSQGQCYLDVSNNKVYKIFYSFLDDEEYIEYNEEEVMKFKNVKNDTYIFPEDILIVEEKIIGYISPYIRAKNLYKINPLLINLDELICNLDKIYRDSKIISEKGIVTYDVMYNILYGQNGISVIDTDDYNYDLFDRDFDEILKINNRNLNFAIKLFLIESYFDEFVLQSRELKEMYEDLDIDVRIFVLKFQKIFSEFFEFKLIYLKQAEIFFNKRKIKEDNIKFKRLIY